MKYIRWIPKESPTVKPLSKKTYSKKALGLPQKPFSPLSNHGPQWRKEQMQSFYTEDLNHDLGLTVLTPGLVLLLQVQYLLGHVVHVISEGLEAAPHPLLPLV